MQSKYLQLSRRDNLQTLLRLHIYKVKWTNRSIETPFNRICLRGRLIASEVIVWYFRSILLPLFAAAEWWMKNNCIISLPWFRVPPLHPIKCTTILFPDRGSDQRSSSFAVDKPSHFYCQVHWVNEITRRGCWVITRSLQPPFLSVALPDS